MDVAAKKHQTKLEGMKSNVKRAYECFKNNYDRFNEFRTFVFESSLSADDLTLLATLSRPQLEFNILEAYISRLLGEFAKHEPSIEVSTDNETDTDWRVVKAVEAHIRHILLDSENNHTQYEVYKDLLSGGFSTFKITTEYANPRSFHQVIKLNRVADPTLCGWDPLARMSHKGDGRYCFELFPMEEERFKEEYPAIDISDISFRAQFEGFSWAYLNDKTKVLLVCDYYEKKSKKQTIVQTADGEIMSQREYDQLLESWQDLTPPPALMGKPRVTETDVIVRYRMIENKVLSYEETDYSKFPLIFVDGNSVLIKTPKNGNVRQVTRPYVYHAKGAQKLKNYAGITWANALENMTQHKFKVAIEALPPEGPALEAYKNVQKASVLMFNAFVENNPNMPIPNPVTEIQQIPMPPEVANAFMATDGLVQNILGAYDASNGINGNDISGKAIIEGSNNSNAAAMPYGVGYLQGLQRGAEIFVDLIPKYYTTPRTIPIMMENGHKGFMRINDPQDEQSLDLFYDENALNVKVEAGVNFRVQKTQALQQIISLMNASPGFAEFINDVGLEVLMDNIEIRGIDQIKEMATQWMEQRQEQQKMMMEQQKQEMQNNPAVIRNQVEMKKIEMSGQREALQHDVDMEKIEMERTKMLADIHQDREDNQVKREEIAARREKIHADIQMKHHELKHKHFVDIAALHHEVHKPPKEESKKGKKK